MVIIIMGVTGCGKSTIGNLLSKRLGLPFIDGDRYHPQSNIDKMSRGIPLDDKDRLPWLIKIATLINENISNGAVIACSALKQKYREILTSDHKKEVQFVYLKASKGLLAERMKKRTGHFMPVELLDSQIQTLEEPHDAIIVDTTRSPEEIVEEIIEHL